MMSSSSIWILRNGHVTAALVSCTYTQQKKLSILLMYCLWTSFVSPYLWPNSTRQFATKPNDLSCQKRKQILVFVYPHYILWIKFINKVDWKFIFSFTNFLGHSYIGTATAYIEVAFFPLVYPISLLLGKNLNSSKIFLIFSVLVFWSDTELELKYESL